MYRVLSDANHKYNYLDNNKFSCPICHESHGRCVLGDCLVNKHKTLIAFCYLCNTTWEETYDGDTIFLDILSENPK